MPEPQNETNLSDSGSYLPDVSVTFAGSENGSSATGLSGVKSTNTSKPDNLAAQSYRGSDTIPSSQPAVQSSTSRQGEVFGTFELATVLSYYDLGVIQTIVPFKRGSRKSPKLILKTDKGRYLLKRRADGRNDAERVMFSHSVQLQLARREFPMPKLMLTRRTRSSILQFDGHIYEVFEFIKGSLYDQSMMATQQAGQVLSLFHRILRNYESQYEASTGSYHNAPAVNKAIDRLPEAIQAAEPETKSDSDQQQTTQTLLNALSELYETAVQKVDTAGYGDWPKQPVHADWHPGNLLYRGNGEEQQVVAVVDYDACRILPRITDIANGVLQFSIIGQGENPDDWPAQPDLTRFKRFLRGYQFNVDKKPHVRLSDEERTVLPDLMIEALVGESVIPIANTGRFGEMSALPFLRMVKHKAAWIDEHREQLWALGSVED